MKRKTSKIFRSRIYPSHEKKEYPYWLVLDVHGVLIPSSERWILHQLSRRTGKSMVGIYFRWFLNLKPTQLGKRSAKSFYEEVLDMRLTEKQFQEWYVKSYAQRGIVSPAIIEQLIRLKKKGWKLAILSDMHSAQATYHRAQKHFGLFDEVFLSCETGMMKPFPNVYAALEKRLNTRKDHIVYCDDLWFNTWMGALNGWRALTIKGPKQLAHFLTDLP